MCDNFRIFLSIHRHSDAAKHCSHIVLKVFDGFRPLILLHTTKKRVTERCSSLVQTESGAAKVNGTVATKELTQQLQTCAALIRRKPHLVIARKRQCCQQKHKCSYIADNHSLTLVSVDITNVLFIHIK